MTLKKLGLLAFAISGLLLMVGLVSDSGLKTAEATVDTVQTFPGDVSSQSECRCGPGCECESCTCAEAELASGPPAEASKQILSGINELAKSVEPGWIRGVYGVRVLRGDGTNYGGTGVAVRGNVVHTASHLADGVRSPKWEVQVGDRWIPAVPNPDGSKDFATLAVNGVTLDPVQVRCPEYGERVTVYGLKTRSLAQGVYIGEFNPGDGKVALDPGELAVENGDSGGGIFGDDGALLGTITGRLTNSSRVTSLTPIESASRTKAVSSGAAQHVSAECPGGVCTQRQPQTFQQYFQPQPSRGFFGRRR